MSYEAFLAAATATTAQTQPARCGAGKPVRMNLLRHITRIHGDALAELRKLPNESVHAVVTSPPYWRLRDYGFTDQLGMEERPDEFVRNLVEVMREVRRVLREDGTCWLNIGDSYVGNGAAYGNAKSTLHGAKHSESNGARRQEKKGPGLKPKDLALIPARLVIALQDDGWYVRNDIVWHKTNGMPSSVKDRCTQNHEYLFFLTKSPIYWFDQDAIKEPVLSDPLASRNRWNRDADSAPGQKPQKIPNRSGNKERVYGVNAMNPHIASSIPWEGTTRNKRTVWSIATKGMDLELCQQCTTVYRAKAFRKLPTQQVGEPGQERTIHQCTECGAWDQWLSHFACFPPDLIRPCIRAGCPPKGVVLDPFSGSGTTGGVAIAEGRHAILIEGNRYYLAMQPTRIEDVFRELRRSPEPDPVPDIQTALFK